jgi:hypothetical protein
MKPGRVPKDDEEEEESAGAREVVGAANGAGLITGTNKS